MQSPRAFYGYSKFSSNRYEARRNANGAVLRELLPVDGTMQIRSIIAITLGTMIMAPITHPAPR